MVDENDRERLRRLRREAAEAKGYDCGYAKPPEANRFSTTNQPRKARKPRKSWAERLAAMADEKVRVTIRGVSRLVTRDDALNAKLMNAALAGDMTAMRMYVNLRSKLPEPRTSDDYTDQTAWFIRKIDEMAARAKERLGEETKPGAATATTSSDDAARVQVEALPGQPPKTE